jgi:hypothetical protein
MRRTTTMGILSWAVLVALFAGSPRVQFAQKLTFVVVSASINTTHSVSRPDVAAGSEATIAAVVFPSRNNFAVQT